MPEVILDLLSCSEGWVTDNEGRSYYVTDKGTVQTGWKSIPDDAHRYYFGKDGVCHKNEVIKAGTKLYYQTEDGIVRSPSGESVIDTAGGGRTIVNENGAIRTGWQTIDGRKYYVDRTTGLALTGTQQIKGVWYDFAPDGKLN